MRRVAVTLYTRRGCHLCDDAKEIILASGLAGTLRLEEVDIDLDPELRARYTNDVPVVAVDGVETFWHHVDPRELEKEIKRVLSAEC